MGYTNHAQLIRKKIVRKLLCIYIVMSLMLLASFSMVFVVKVSASPGPPVIVDDSEYPRNESTGVPLYPTHIINVNDAEGDNMNITFRCFNSSDLSDYNALFRGKINFNSTNTFSFTDDDPKNNWDEMNNDTILGTWFTCPANGTAYGIRFIIHAQGGAIDPVHLQYAIYNKSDYTLLDNGNTSKLTCETNWGPGWKASYFQSPYPPLEAGRKYYVVIRGHKTRESTNILSVYKDPEPGLNRSINVSEPYTGSFPETLNPSNITYVEDWIYKIEVLYNTTSVGNGMYYMDNFHVDSFDTTYWWSVNVTDGLDSSWTNRTYHFTTLKPETVYVDDDYTSSTQGWNSSRFGTIQNGIDAVAENGTVYVYNGTYYENVIVNKSISLIGNATTNTTINGTGSGSVVSIVNDSVNISGFTITNSSSGVNDAGIHVSSNYTRISGNNISENNNAGINISSTSSNNIIYHNNFINNTKNAYDANTTNTWYNTTLQEGNYWSDFDESDEGAWDNNSDGIVDSPYNNISGGDNQDLYPLTGPWGERPNQPICIQPLDGTTGVSTSPTLEVMVTDPNGDTMNVSFYDASNDDIIGVIKTNVASGNNTSLTWPDLEYFTPYKWYSIANDSTYLTRSGNWSFTTKSRPSSGDDDDTDTPPSIDVYHEPTTITSSDTVTIYTNVTDDNSISSVNLYWNDGSDHSEAMTLKEDNVYYKTIGPFSELTTVTYYIIATDNANQSTTSGTYSFTVKDTSGPTITIITPPAGSIIYDTTPLIKASYSDPNGINTSSITLTIDGNTVTNPTSITSTTIIHTPATNRSYGMHNLTLKVSDTLGNTETKEWSFTIEQSESIAEENLGNVTSGENITVTPENSEQTGVDSVDFTLATNLTNVKLTVVKLTDTPEAIPSPENVTIYKYLGIALTADDKYVEEDELTSLKIKFKVKKAWIIENNIDNETMRLMRYHNNEWQNLTTTFLGEDSTYKYYEATVKGLSTFAVVGSTITEIPEPYTKGVPEVPWAVIIAVIIVATITLVVILFKAGYIYTEGGRRKEETEKKDKK